MTRNSFIASAAVLLFQILAFTGTAGAATATLTQNTATTKSQESFTVNWSSTGASGCTLTAFGSSYSVGTSGSTSATPENPGDHTISVNCGGATASVVHTVLYPTGSISNASCAITAGQSTCTANMSWSTTNTMKATGWDGSGVSFQGTGGTSGVVVTNGSKTITLRNGSATSGIYLGQATASGSCASGTTWNGSVCVAAPTVSVTQTKSITASKEPFTVSWTSTGATYCDIALSGPTPTQTLTNQPTSGTTQPLTPQNLGTYTMAVTCYSASQSGTNGVTHTVNGSDLIAGSITPLTASVGVPKTFSATITNNSGYSTIEGFTSLFQQGTTATGGAVADIASVDTASALAANGKVTLSTSYTFTNPGVYYVRLCADKNSSAGSGTITESDENNNCGTWTAIDVTKVGDKTVARGTAVSITSNMGGSATSCITDTTYPSLSDGVQSAWKGTTKTSGQITNFSPVLASPGSYVFSCANGSITDSAILNIVDCASGTTWNGTSCMTVDTSPTATLTVSDCTIASEASTCSSSVSWTSANLTTTLSVRQNGTQFSNSATNTGTSRTLSYGSGGSNKFTAVHNGATLDTKTGTASCASGSTWDGTKCAANPSPSGSLTLSPMSCTIAVDASTCSTIYATWTTSNVSSAALVDRNVNSTLSTSLNRSSPGLQVWVAYPNTTFDLKNSSTGATLDTDTATAACGGGSSWNGSVCACPAGQTAVSGSCVLSPVIRNEAVNYPNITFICDNSTNYSVVRSEGSFSQSGSTTSGATVTVPITMEGNYTLSCVSGALNDSTIVNYTQVATTMDGMFINANPRTINNNKSTTLSWSVDNPKSTCSLRAEAVCAGGRASCSQAQLTAETAINSTLTNGTTDANDPYGAGRNIQTAVQTVAPENNPTGTKALGKKTLLMNYSTDFILDCGGSLLKKVRVNVSAENEG